MTVFSFYVLKNLFRGWKALLWPVGLVSGGLRPGGWVARQTGTVPPWGKDQGPVTWD